MLRAREVGAGCARWAALIRGVHFADLEHVAVRGPVQRAHDRRRRPRAELPVRGALLAGGRRPRAAVRLDLVVRPERGEPDLRPWGAAVEHQLVAVGADLPGERDLDPAQHVAAVDRGGELPVPAVQRRQPTVGQVHHSGRGRRVGGGVDADDAVEPAQGLVRASPTGPDPRTGTCP